MRSTSCSAWVRPQRLASPRRDHDGLVQGRGRGDRTRHGLARPAGGAQPGPSTGGPPRPYGTDHRRHPRSHGPDRGPRPGARRKRGPTTLAAVPVAGPRLPSAARGDGDRARLRARAGCPAGARGQRSGSRSPSAPASARWDGPTTSSTGTATAGPAAPTSRSPRSDRGRDRPARHGRSRWWRPCRCRWHRAGERVSSTSSPSPWPGATTSGSRRRPGAGHLPAGVRRRPRVRHAGPARAPAPGAWAVAAAGLLGLGAHLVDALPDLDDDVAAGRPRPAAAPGPQWSLAFGVALLAVAAALVALGPPGQPDPWAVASLVVVATAIAVVAASGRAAATPTSRSAPPWWWPPRPRCCSSRAVATSRPEPRPRLRPVRLGPYARCRVRARCGCWVASKPGHETHRPRPRGQAPGAGRAAGPGRAAPRGGRPPHRRDLGATTRRPTRPTRCRPRSRSSAGCSAPRRSPRAGRATCSASTPTTSTPSASSGSCATGRGRGGSRRPAAVGRALRAALSTSCGAHPCATLSDHRSPGRPPPASTSSCWPPTRGWPTPGSPGRRPTRWRGVGRRSSRPPPPRAVPRPADPGAVPLRSAGRGAARLPGRPLGAASRSSASSPGPSCRRSSAPCSRTTPRPRPARAPPTPRPSAAPAATALPRPASRRGVRAGPPLVGRDGRAGGRARATSPTVVAGAGRVVLLGGEPGIGKSRLAEELAADASTAGRDVVWGRCYEGRGAPAFWPWTQVVRACSPATTPTCSAPRSARGRRDLAQIVPEVKELVDDFEPPPPLDPESARFRALPGGHRASCAAWRRERRPLAVVLDDIHWADDRRSTLLAFLAAEVTDRPCARPPTYRDVDPLIARPLADALVQRRPPGSIVRRLDLAGPRPGRPRTASSPPRGGGPTTSRRRRAPPHPGQPVLPHRDPAPARDGRARDDTPRGSRVPRGVRDVMRQRVPAPARADAAAPSPPRPVLGQDFDCRCSPTVLDLDTARARPARAGAARAGIVRDSPDGRRRYRFSHGLVNETVYDDLGAARRGPPAPPGRRGPRARHGTRRRPHLLPRPRTGSTRCPPPRRRPPSPRPRSGSPPRRHVAHRQAEEQLRRARAGRACPTVQPRATRRARGPGPAQRPAHRHDGLRGAGPRRGLRPHAGAVPALATPRSSPGAVAPLDPLLRTEPRHRGRLGEQLLALAATTGGPGPASSGTWRSARPDAPGRSRSGPRAPRRGGRRCDRRRPRRQLVAVVAETPRRVGPGVLGLELVAPRRGRPGECRRRRARRVARPASTPTP